MVVFPFYKSYKSYKSYIVGIKKVQLNKKRFTLIAISALAVFIVLKPHEFIDLWLTKDQQGQILFNNGYYKQASKTFTNIHWQAFSAYGNEDYKNAATLYSQFDDKESLLAQANALAHSRNNLKARDLYQTILSNFPNYAPAQHNLDIVQKIIDEINMLSEAKQPEQGESIKELGDEPQSGDGADKQELKTQEVEQLNADQLLNEKNLNDMWLRQVQKDPARFLSQKFYFQQIQNEKRKQKATTKQDSKQKTDQGKKNGA